MVLKVDKRSGTSGVLLTPKVYISAGFERPVAIYEVAKGCWHFSMNESPALPKVTFPLQCYLSSTVWNHYTVVRSTTAHKRKFWYKALRAPNFYSNSHQVQNCKHPMRDFRVSVTNAICTVLFRVIKVITRYLTLIHPTKVTAISAGSDTST